MELGNFLFGNSRGQYPVDRVLQDAFYLSIGNALEDIECDLRCNKFENDAFAIFPYWWGDCACGYDEKECEWDQQNDHKEDCGRGVSVPHCTCGFQEAWNEFRQNNRHDADCPIVRPNLIYKPTGLEIRWYKYPLRDSYMNQNLSNAELIEIFVKCAESINSQQDAEV
jgi:hypothetical protein